MPYFEYGGLYPEPRRNEPVKLKEVNPLPENAKSQDTGIAGRDGYTVLSRASRYSGQRPLAGSEAAQQLLGPNLAEEI
jgi:hypothetical protein